MVDYAQKIKKDMIGYRQDPIGFAKNILGFPEKYIWPKMVDLCEGVRDHQKVCVRAGHSVSKTFCLGRIIVPWFKVCFTPSTVVTTAPSENQVKNQLWREIRASKVSAKVPLGGKIHTVHWDMVPKKSILDERVRLGKMDSFERADWEKNFAIGFSTSPDACAEHVTKMQGWHNKWVLVVIDEGCGMVDAILDAALKSLIIDHRCKIVIAGNPTDPECKFALYCYSSDPKKQEGHEPYISDRGWYVITIPSTSTPNYQQRKSVIPGLASYEWAEEIIKEHGEDGDVTRYRVKGLFPTFKEGTYYGSYLANARKNGRIGEVPHVKTAKVFTFSDTGDRWTFTIFVQFIRGNVHCIDEYWDNEGMGLPEWVNELQSKPYTYGEDHYAGPDIDPDQGGNAKSFHTGKTLVKVSGNLGYQLKPVMKHSFNDGMASGRHLWDVVWISKTKCPILLQALAGYGKKKNMTLSQGAEVVYHDQPAKTWHRHPADAWRHLAIAVEHMEIDGIYLGDVAMTAQYHESVRRRKGMIESQGMRNMGGMRTI